MSYGLNLQPVGLDQVRNCKESLKNIFPADQKLLVIYGPTRELTDTYNVMFGPLSAMHPNPDVREEENLRIWNWLASGRKKKETEFNLFPDAPAPAETRLEAAERIIRVQKRIEEEARSIGAAILYIVPRETMRILAGESIGNPIEEIANIPKPDYAELWEAKDGILRSIRFGCLLNETKPRQKEAFMLSGHNAASRIGHNHLGLEISAPRPRQEEPA